MLRKIKILKRRMFGWLDCCNSYSDSVYEEFEEEEEFNTFSLPSPLPPWPKGKDFDKGKICLGEIEVIKITKFDKIWSCSPSRGKAKGVSFYRPVGIPDGFFSLGYCCVSRDKKSRGCYALAAKSVLVDAIGDVSVHNSKFESPPLVKPVDYSLVWSSNSRSDGSGYIWIPNPPEGYRPMGFVVTVEPQEPDIEEVRCVRADLTESCEVSEVMFDNNSILSKDWFCVWDTRPSERGMLCNGVPIGTFFCSRDRNRENEEMSVSCLKNLDSSLHAMPTLEQIHALIEHYGPKLYLHPDEVYFPSSVSWFFENGALLCERGKDKGLAVDLEGTILPLGGENDKEFWLDVGENGDYVKRGNIESAELYVHVKPAFGGTFTDVVMWIFCPFNGPSAIKAGPWSYTFDKIGQHVGDWEHFTLRLSNFEGELSSVYFSEHSGGGWLDASELEFFKGNKPIVYASKHGHASFPHEGCYIQGSSKLGIGARNDCAKSKFSIDSSTRFKIVAAEYLENGAILEPHWLQYMREWGPTVVYDSTSELEKILNHLPFFIRFSMENLVELFPTEIYGEEGPTGPKEKDNWCGDERY